MKSPVKQKLSTLQTIINNAQTGGGGGGTVDAYTKAEADAKFETQSNASSTYLSKSTAQSTYLAIADADEVPTVTSGDNGKVLTATYSEGTGSYAWATPSGGGTSDYTDLSNKTSINSVTLSGNKTTSDLGIDEVPEVTSSDKGKVLTAGNVGQYQWKYLLPPLSASDANAFVIVNGGGTGYNYYGSIDRLPPTITSSDAGKVLMANYSGGTGYAEWVTPPLPKYITTIDSITTGYTLGNSVDNLRGFFKFIIYALDVNGKAMQGEFYEGYYCKNTPGPIETFEPYNTVYSPSVFSTTSGPNMTVNYMGSADETVQIIEIPINTFT